MKNTVLHRHSNKPILFLVLRIMVLDAGEIKEFNSPQALMQDTNSIFHGMAKDAGLA